MGDDQHGGPEGRGVDVSAWQGHLDRGFFSRWRFAIARAHSGFGDDVVFLENTAALVASGTPWGVYGYMVAQRDRSWQATRVVELTRSLGFGDPPLGYWCDAEELSDETDAILEYTGALLTTGAPIVGYYTNDWRADHSRLGHLPYWLAGYPWPNDGRLSPLGWTRRAPQLWQFTSTSGDLDQNVVIDEAWYAAHATATPAPPPPEPIKEVLDVLTVGHGLGKLALTDGGIVLADWTEGPYGEYGVPLAAHDWLAKQPAQPANLNLADPDGTMNELAEWLWGEYLQRTKVASTMPATP